MPGSDSGLLAQAVVPPFAHAWVPDLAEEERLGLYTGVLSSVSGLPCRSAARQAAASSIPGCRPLCHGWLWPPYRLRRLDCRRDGGQPGRHRTSDDSLDPPFDVPMPMPMPEQSSQLVMARRPEPWTPGAVVWLGL